MFRHSASEFREVLAKPVLFSHDERALLLAAAGRGCVTAKLHLQRDHYSAVASASAAASAHAGTVLSGACRGTAPSLAGAQSTPQVRGESSSPQRMHMPRIEGWVYTGV
jgi:hypothetical protein